VQAVLRGLGAQGGNVLGSQRAVRGVHVGQAGLLRAEGALRGHAQEQQVVYLPHGLLQVEVASVDCTQTDT
jgi:hypothetical protein